jgi:hypothetical protein
VPFEKLLKEGMQLPGHHGDLHSPQVPNCRKKITAQKKKKCTYIGWYFWASFLKQHIHNKSIFRNSPKNNRKEKI